MSDDKIMHLPQTDVQVFSPDDVISQITLIQDIMKSVMRENEHYGKIPGTQKPTLLKPGAEKLGLTFRLAPYFEGWDKPIVYDNGHVKYVINCTLKHIQTGQIWGQGVGSCSSMESKYRYRWVDTNEKPTKEFADDLKAKGVGRWRKYNDDWIWQKRTENPDIADVDNTILKMAKKRAHVDAMLNATAASDIFTQDIEDIPHIVNGNQPTIKESNGNNELHTKQKHIGNMLMTLWGEDKEKAANALLEYSKSDDPKYKPFNTIKAIKSVKQANFLIQKIEKDNPDYDWKEFKKNGTLTLKPEIVEDMFEQEPDPGAEINRE